MGKAMVEDTRFEELWKVIRDRCNAEVFMIAKMALDDPGNLSDNPEYLSSRLRFNVLQDVSDRAEELDNVYKDAAEGLAA
jgi:hypothetical protein